MFENRVLRRILRPKKDEVTGNGENYIMRSLVICTPCVGGKIKKNEMGGACDAYWGRVEVCTGFWWGNLRERDHWGDPDVDGRIILRWIFRKWEGVVGNGWSWLRIGTGGGHS